MTEPRPGGGRLEAASVSGGDLVVQLRTTLDRAAELVRVLESNLSALSAAGTGGPRTAAERVVELESRLHAAEADVKELADRLVDSEHQAGRLMNLYVATYQLHASLDPEEVQQTIAEIAINLLGARRFALLLRRDEGVPCEVALAEGIDDGDPVYGGGSYRGGVEMVDATLEDGILRVARVARGGGAGPAGAAGTARAEGEVLAAVPLRVMDTIVGALVVLELLDHKPLLGTEDRDLLDLLSAHAASALFAARLYSAKDRRLRSLESLVRLARGE